jgi:hypothetical protein
LALVLVVDGRPKELCEKGLKTLILERGQDVVHIKDYPTATKNPWDFAHRGTKTNALKNGNPIVSKCYAYNETSAHFFVKDQQHPYEQEKPFDWIRGYQEEENHCFGPDKHKDGVAMILKVLLEMDLVLGQLGIMI